MTRIGSSQAFFNIVAQFNAEKLIRDTASMNTVMKAVSLDTFEAILKPIDDMIMQLDNAIDAVKDLGIELGNATVEFEKFYGETANIEPLKDELIGIGEAFGIVGTEALAAGSRAAQVGNLIGRQNIDLLVKQAAILSEISDLSLEEAQRGMIQLNQQAGILYGEMTRQQIMSLSAREQEIILNENAARSLDVLNTVANRSVALEGDLVKTMKNFASGANLAGDSFEFMAAASATLLEAGEEQGTAGRALRMIYARLGGDINGARSKIQDMGFQLEDSSGQMKNMEDVLQELTDKGFHELSGAQKQNIAQTIAGNRHYVRFIKLMENQERITQLTSDAFARLDSASQQAETALESNVRTLTKSEAKIENLKAAIGEGLTPVMIGQNEVMIDMLSATEMLTDGLGENGRYVGRFIGAFKATEGFLKFGIAIQSIGIGLSMFTSVQRSLHGIEIAMANLHSKQSAYLDYGVTATNDQKDLMKGLLHHQQVLNRASKEHALAKGLIGDREKRISDILKERAVINQQIKDRTLVVAELSERMVHIENKRLAVAAADDSMYAKRAARINFENQTGQELLATQKDIYMQKRGAEDAYMRQMLADFDVFGAFNDDQQIALERRNEDLREQHTILQQIKAENEAMRSLRGTDQTTGQFGRGFDEGQIEAQIAHYEERLSELSFEKLSGKAYGALSDDQKMAYDSSSQLHRGLTQLKEAFESHDEPLQLGREGYDVLINDLSHTAGAFYQTERAMRTVEAAQHDVTLQQKELSNIGRVLGGLKSANISQEKKMNSLTGLSLGLSKQIKPLKDQINAADATKNQQSQAMASIINILTNAEKDNTAALAAKQAQMAKTYATSEQYRRDEERRIAATQSLHMGLGNLAGLMGSTFSSGAKMAAANMAMMSTQLIHAGKATMAAGIELVKVQYQMYATQFAAAGATASMTKFKAVMLTTARVALPIVAAGGIFYMIAKRAEETQEKISEMNEVMMNTESILGRFNNSTKLLSDDALADTLGVTNYEMSELKGNSELTAEVLGKLTDHGQSFSKSIQKAVDESVDLLNALQAIQSQGGVMNEAMFEQTASGMFESMTGVFPSLKRFYSSTHVTRQDIEAFYENNGLSFDPGFFKSNKDIVEGFAQDLVQVMRSGYKLSNEDLDLVSSVYGEGSEVTTAIRTMNALVMTYDDASYYSKQFEGAADDTSSAISGQISEIQNLTEEIYNFGDAREELFFGGKYGNVTGSLYKQVVKQGVGTLYHKNEIIMSNNFHGFFNEREAADKIIAVLDEYVATR